MSKLALGCAGVLLLGELVLRFGAGLGDPPLVVMDDPEIEYRLIPSQSYRRFGNRIIINQHGLRGEEFEPARAPHELRVLLIGDSVVYGNHFLDQSETIAARLHNHLQPLLPEGCRLTTVPVAASSWGPPNQLAYLDRFGVYDANAALIVQSAHDLWDVPQPRNDVVPYRLARPWGAIGDAVQAAYERLGREYAPPQNPVPREERAAHSTAAFRKMLTQLADAGIATLLYLHPEKGAGGSSHPAWTAFRGVALETGVRVHDMTPEFTRPDYYRDFIHPTASGADHYARRLAQDLATLGCG